METRPLKRSKVADFYAGRKLFVTGATGFLGKVLIHKLLSCSPDLGGIYVLIRPKHGQEPQERLKQLFEGVIFKGMAQNLLDKVKALSGDITLPKLGLSEVDEATLISQVSVVFHSAATVKFEEDFSKSVTMNVQGTLAVIDLARKMGSNLASFVHVSTAYSHCYKSSCIEETFYDNDTSPSDVIEIVKRVSASILDEPEVTKKLIGKHPNTYTFTKAVAEQALQEKAADLPLSIFRPSIVVAASKEPVPGWVDNVNGPTGVFTGYASGVLRTMLVDMDKKADLIPVDFCINMLCVLGWKTGVTGQQQLQQQLPGSPSSPVDSNNNSIPIYNYTSGECNPIYWKAIDTHGRKLVSKHPLEFVIWYPGGSYRDSWILDRLCRMFLHYLPALIIDLVLLLIPGKKPFMWKLICKMHKAMQALEYFSTRQWSWSNDNVHALNDELDEQDKALFNCDLRKLPAWDSFLENYILGIRQYICKSSPDTLEKSRFRLKLLYVADCLLKLVLLFILYQILSLMFWR